MSDANKKVASELLAAMYAADGDAMDQCLTRDAFTNTRGFAGVSGRRSREMMVTTASAFREIVPTGFQPKIKKAVAEGETVVLEFEGDAVLNSGAPYFNQYVFVLSFDDSKIKQLNALLAQRGEDYVKGDSN